MLNQGGITKKSGYSARQILANVDLQYSIGVVVAQAAGTDGVVKAGTPVTGDLDDRTTPFTKAGAGDAVGVLLHDVSVKDGDGNATLLIFGFVNTNRLADDVKALITSDVKEALAAKVTFLAV